MLAVGPTTGRLNVSGLWRNAFNDLPCATADGRAGRRRCWAGVSWSSSPETAGQNRLGLAVVVVTTSAATTSADGPAEGAPQIGPAEAVGALGSLEDHGASRMISSLTGSDNPSELSNDLARASRMVSVGSTAGVAPA